MTTYNSYEAAKVANPECEIYKLVDSGLFDFCTHIKAENVRLTEHGSDGVRCNPADHCMTVEKFLADGHKFVEGDVYLNSNGRTLGVVNIPEYNNKRSTIDCNLYILRAAALEEKSSEKAEWKNGDECVYNGINWLFCGFHPTNGLAIVADNDSPALHHLVTVDIELLSKPETQQQREDRERLENGKALYELVQKIWCDVDSKYTAHPYESGMVDDNVKEMYARLAIETSYRKDGK